MRSFITILSLFSLAAPSIFASPVPECVTELCGSADLFKSSTNIPTRSISARAIDVLTNAQRFARGLPPKKPKLIQGSPVRRQQPSSTPSDSYRGYIQVNRADGSGTLGYISQSSLSGAQTRYQSDTSTALIVDFKLPAGATSGSTLDFTIESSDLSGNYQYLGLVQGRDDNDSDIAAGSYQYLYIAATAQTAPNATPRNAGNSYSSATGRSRTSESAVWSFDGTTNAITVQWVNSDGSTPTTNTWTQSTALYAGGDQGQFYARYPAPVIGLTYKFVPI
ncbi:hypothetical protein FRC04_003628 [Tulasnella sp. 424]|nr:hypothetical protein FRC04_003628 [Tulasnella sp. 424]KAG8965495.1 hypothetical protein FRC05_003228 [Tulasnella sp. 425]